ncbi:MAG: hypothetical protein K8S98_07690 [Planctomycetes bacterium]|nr:hypothetical protein [Planctomycetota bacterium]
MRASSILVCGLLVTSCSPESAAPNDRALAALPSLAEIRADAERAKQAILAEIANGDLPVWAGEYVARTSWYWEKLYLAPKSGFMYAYDGCIAGAPLFGPVVVDGDVVRLPSLGGARGYSLESTMVPVRAGGKRLLLGVRATIEACDAWNWTHEVEDSYLTHVEDAKLEHDGKFEVPPSFARYVVDPPIIGSAMSACIAEDPTGFAGQRLHVTIGLGGDRRAAVGMGFQAECEDGDGRRQRAKFVVESVGPAGELTLVANDRKQRVMPRVGARASTGRF